MRALALIVPIGIALIAAAVFALAPSGHQARAQATTTIQIGDLWFCNDSFSGGVCETTIAQGDTVEWQWTGEAPHTTTECGGDLENCAPPHLWDSPQQDTGSFSFTFDTPGTYVYRCQVHPTDMQGSITVEAAAQPTPQPTTATPQATTAASPQASPGTVLPAAGGPSSVPNGGGAPPSGGGADSGLWLALAGGFLLAATGSLVALSVRRR